MIVGGGLATARVPGMPFCTAFCTTFYRRTWPRRCPFSGAAVARVRLAVLAAARRLAAVACAAVYRLRRRCR
eukprot:scaffold80276_cov62-Phaeocystis_antarctica.AAC.1